MTFDELCKQVGLFDAILITGASVPLEVLNKLSFQSCVRLYRNTQKNSVLRVNLIGIIVRKKMTFMEWVYLCLEGLEGIIIEDDRTLSWVNPSTKDVTEALLYLVDKEEPEAIQCIKRLVARLKTYQPTLQELVEMYCRVFDKEAPDRKHTSGLLINLIRDYQDGFAQWYKRYLSCSRASLVKDNGRHRYYDLVQVFIHQMFETAKKINDWSQLRNVLHKEELTLREVECLKQMRALSGEVSC